MGELVLICRPDYRAALEEELALRWQLPAPPLPRAGAAPALMVLDGDSARAVRRDGRQALIFARQWIDDARWVAAGRLAEPDERIVAEWLAVLDRTPRPWTVHAYAADPEGGHEAAAEAAALRERVLRYCGGARPDWLARYVEPRALKDEATLVLQLCVPGGGAWLGWSRAGDLLDTHPGGIHRKKFDPASPSRSYMKIEEAFDHLGEEPRAGQTVVDLGAAPGGWTHAFLKRGCRVLAVDRGPMKVGAEAGRGQFRQVLEDGLSFQPPGTWLPADWLVSDMLVPPGKTLGLLRRWCEARWMKRVVVNVKIPQQHPYPVLQPIEDFLGRVPGLTCRVRQLYHDRREVTVFGRFGMGRSRRMA